MRTLGLTLGALTGYVLTRALLRERTLVVRPRLNGSRLCSHGCCEVVE